MSARGNSRYANAGVAKDAEGRTFIQQEDPVPYQPRFDNVLHMVKEGETLELLADRFFGGLADSALLYWIVGQFQPEPIQDPTEALEGGTIMVIPSQDYVNSDVLARIQARAPRLA
jgi:hypothetical protein